MATNEDLKLGVDVSTETIKPSSPTPPHLQTHTLSWIDQITPRMHICLVLFYLGGDEHSGGYDISEKLRQLKQSLSQALALYYPLAGRMGWTTTVNCTDEGVDFIEARATCPISAVLRQPEPEKVDRLLPCSRMCTMTGAWGPLLVVKATTFDCGGMALGLCFRHTVADAQSLACFLKTWAAIARKIPGEVARRPSLGVAAVAFPPLFLMPPFVPAPALASGRRLVTRRFVLDGTRICALRERSAAEQPDGTPQQRPRRLTRVEVVTALIWRCLIRASSSADEFAAAHVVNLRARMQPPLPETAFGNIMTLAITPALVVPREHRRPCGVPADEVTMKSSTLRRLTEEKTSDTIRNVDAGYIRETLQGAAAPLGCACRLGKCLWRGVRLAWFSSLWGFPFYETDFGWGSPVWVAGAGNEVIQAEGVTLMGRREGSGHMEAWVRLEAEEMDRLDKDPELLTLISSDPLPSLPSCV
ncbi:hypothetical protein Taro_026037 [Colocasia esculenta]|uniref:Uncharacterized protein n=1 Tax=Colocasia esculenta TaxID=4460 RepID=A0A843VMB2_COLES|nr:hypothetical protein [Colocasia esculenta]